MPPNKWQLKIESIGHRWIGRIHPMWGARREEEQWPPATDREPVVYVSIHGNWVAETCSETQQSPTDPLYLPASRVRDAYNDFGDYLRGATETIWIQRATLFVLAALLWWRW